MIEFVIDEENEELNQSYQMVILGIFGYREEEFKIYNLNDFKQDNCNSKIYILSNPNQNLQIAEQIRKSGDWHSQIIIVGTKYIKHNKLLILDWIDKNDTLKENLKSAINTACQIISRKKTLNFMLNSEIYKIPFKDILYIEKVNNQNYCTIYTNNSNYIINETIRNLEDKLPKCCFMKTHRSCIVNLNNIRSYNLTNNKITFDNQETDLISRDRRKLLKEHLISTKINK